MWDCEEFGWEGEGEECVEEEGIGSAPCCLKGEDEGV